MFLWLRITGKTDSLVFLDISCGRSRLRTEKAQPADIFVLVYCLFLGR